MKLKVNSNRMNLLRLRKRLKFAIRGHKLLKDKQEQLSKEFNSLIKKLLTLREETEKQLIEIYNYLKQLLQYKLNKQIENIFEIVNKHYNFQIKSRIVVKFNIKYKEYYLEKNEQKLNLYFDTDPYINYTILKMIGLYEQLIYLSNLEGLCEAMTKELETIRRRVNALEYVLIPQIRSAIKFIINRLNEFERTNITQLMRIKQLME